MTLFVLEGPSASGKSTVRDELLDENPQWIKWKGENLMRKGPGDHWKEYQRRYHEALHRLYELNPENIIVADRAFTDCVYNPNDEFRAEMRRLAACYGNVHILFFAPFGADMDESNLLQKISISDLKERGSRDMHNITDIVDRYESLLEMFDHKLIDTKRLTAAESTQEAMAYIEETHADEDHNPDI